VAFAVLTIIGFRGVLNGEFHAGNLPDGLHHRVALGEGVQEVERVVIEAPIFKNLSALTAVRRIRKPNL